jgi:mono/diheme cytochrome c family protein
MKPRALLVVALVCFGLAAVVFIIGLVMMAGLMGIYPGPGPHAYLRQGELGSPRAAGPVMGPGMRWGQPGPLRGRPPRGKSSFASNGERIYYLGIDAAGDPIPFAGGPRWMATDGGSCVDCHGADGRGGLAIIPGGDVSADIRYAVLTGRGQEPVVPVPTTEGAIEHERRPYTDALIKRAIAKGLDADGRKLDMTMPRYRMSASDLNDLIGYLKQLGKGR